jgi:hypothetical protein
MSGLPQAASFHDGGRKGGETRCGPERVVELQWKLTPAGIGRVTMHVFSLAEIVAAE